MHHDLNFWNFNQADSYLKILRKWPFWPWLKSDLKENDCGTNSGLFPEVLELVVLVITSLRSQWSWWEVCVSLNLCKCIYLPNPYFFH